MVPINKEEKNYLAKIKFCKIVNISFLLTTQVHSGRQMKN
jgi:hypothetical protein